MRRTRAWFWTGSFEPSPSVAKASSALLVYVLIIHLLYDISYTMSSKTLHSLKTDAHAKSLPTDADIRPAESALSFPRSEEHTSELQSLMRITYAVLCLKKKNKI